MGGFYGKCDERAEGGYMGGKRQEQPPGYRTCAHSNLLHLVVPFTVDKWRDSLPGREGIGTPEVFFQ